MSSTDIHTRLSRQIRKQQNNILKTIATRIQPPHRIFRYHGLESNRTHNILFIGDVTTSSGDLPFRYSMVGPHVSLTTKVDDLMLRNRIQHSIKCTDATDRELFIVIRLHGDYDSYYYRTTNGREHSILKCTMRRIITEVVVELGLKKVYVIDNSCYGDGDEIDGDEFVGRFLPTKSIDESLSRELNNNFLRWYSIVDVETENCAELIYGNHFTSPLLCVIQDHMHCAHELSFHEFILNYNMPVTVKFVWNSLDLSPLLDYIDDDPEDVIVESKSIHSSFSVLDGHSKIDEDILGREVERAEKTLDDLNEFIYNEDCTPLHQKKEALMEGFVTQGKMVECACGHHTFASNIRVE